MDPTEAARPVPSGYPSAQQPVPGQQMPAPPGTPQPGQPQFGAPPGQPQRAPHQIGQPQLGQPQLGQHQLGQPQLGQPQLGQPQLGQPGSPAPVSGWPLSAPPRVDPAAAPGRRSPLAVVLIVMLALLLVGQAVFLGVLQHRLSQANQRAAADRAADGKRVDSLDARIKALEQRSAQSLDPAAVSGAVLPSVFLIDAVNSEGTAFAIGKAPSDGGTDLMTAFHVVADLYNGGGRKVALTHNNERFTANITKVDKDQDVALLHSTEKFPRLAAASQRVPTGTPIVVVGAPLGLSQSVTTGVVSAVRSDVPGEGGKTFIQFSAPINPGNSGGPVVNAQKQVVGIATLKAPDAEGIGLAVPIEVACQSFSIC